MLASKGLIIFLLLKHISELEHVHVHTNIDDDFCMGPPAGAQGEGFLTRDPTGSSH